MLRFDTSTGEFIDDSEKKPNASMILYGKKAPDESLGKEGDFYIETESWEIYQKTESGWGDGVSLIGSNGADGEDGLPGKDGVDGKDGQPGEPGENGLDGLQGLPGLNGKDGKEVELRANATHFQWRYVGEEWKDLAPVPKNIMASSGGGRWRLKDLANKLSAGSNITLTTDDANDVIIIASSGGGSGHAIQDEGTPLTARANLNFVGAGVTVTDDAGNDATVVTIPIQTSIVGITGTKAEFNTACTDGDFLYVGDAVTSVTGTANRITSSGGTTPVIDISASYTGQASITTVGTITSGVWNGTDIAFANIAQGSALSVLGVTGNATADVASIAAGTDNQVLRRSGTSLAFGAVNLASSNAVTGDLPFANLAQLSANSVFANPTTGTADGQAVTMATNTVLARATGANVDDIAVGFGLTLNTTSLRFNLAETKVDWTGDHSWLDQKFTLYGSAGSFQYVFRTSAIAAHRDVTLPLLAANDTIVFENHAQTLANKTLTSPVLNTSISGTAFLDEDDMASDSATKLASQQSIKAYTDNRANYKSPISGRYYGPEGAAQFPGTQAVLNDWTFFAPFKCDFPFTLDKVYLEVTTAAAGNIRFGVYTDVNGVPTSRIATLGTVSSGTTGVKSLTGLAQAMSAGRFWLAFQTDAIIGTRTFNGTVLGNDSNSQIGVAAYNTVLSVSTDLTSTYAGGLPATPSITLLAIDTPMIYWGA